MKTKNKKVEDHLTLSEINDVLKEYRFDYLIYRRVLLIRMILKGETISKTSSNLNISRKTGERWLKNYNESGLEGLIPKYSNCGRKSRLSDEQLQQLRKMITESNKYYNIEQVRQLIKKEFNVDYTYKQVWCNH